MEKMSREKAYEILGLPPGADEKAIREAYHELLKEYHPDNQPDEKTIYKYYLIVEAYDILTKGDSELRYVGRTSNIYRKENTVYKGNTSETKGSAPRVFGDSDALTRNQERKKAQKARERYEKNTENIKEKRLQELIEAERQEQEKVRKEKEKQESVERALKSIQSIIASRIIEEYMHSRAGKSMNDSPDDENIENK